MRVAVGRRGFSRIIFHSSGEFWLFLPKRGSAIFPTPRSSPSDPIMHCFRATNQSPAQFLGYQVICYPYFPPFLVVSVGLCLDQPNAPVYAACSDADFPLPPYGYNIPQPIHTCMFGCVVDQNCSTFCSQHKKLNNNLFMILLVKAGW